MLFAAVACLPKHACAYDAPGHFYTVTFALEQLNPDPSPSWDSDRRVIDFCSWLPDASVELSATSVLTAAASSYSFTNDSNLNAWTGIKMLFSHPIGAYEISGCPFNLDPDRINFDVQTMQPVVIVQQFIHGLTGGDPETVSSVARDLAKTLWNQAKEESDQEKRTDLLCATGFALHLLGDSWAHRHLSDEDHASETPMYPTGCGHASAPGGGHLPDHPLDFGNRWKDWESYFGDIAIVFASGFKANSTKWFDTLTQPSPTSDDNECLLEGSLWAHIDAHHTKSCSHPDLIAGPDFGIPCREYVQKWTAQYPLGVAPNCQETWAWYKDAAMVLFARQGAIAPQFDYNNSYFGMKRFYEMANPKWQQ